MHQAYIFLLLFTLFGCGTSSTETQTPDFPTELVSVQPLEDQAVFQGTGQEGDWDKKIRERGFILYENGQYTMWYTGFNYDLTKQMKLGYATSSDGIHWQRHPDNPIFDKKWTEDMFVQKVDNEYYMFAEGVNDLAHLMKSTDGIHWEEQGDLVIYETDGSKVQPPYGTPSIWIEDGKWYLFYEKTDMGIWLATSEDKIHWTNVQDDPVLAMGPEKYDAAAVATNQIIKYKGAYYMYYHASNNPEWISNKPSTPVLWTSNIARSDDLIHWVKYPGNPIVKGDFSSPIVIMDHEMPTLYTMHDQVRRYRHSAAK